MLINKRRKSVSHCWLLVLAIIGGSGLHFYGGFLPTAQANSVNKGDANDIDQSTATHTNQPLLPTTTTPATTTTIRTIDSAPTMATIASVVVNSATTAREELQTVSSSSSPVTTSSPDLDGSMTANLTSSTPSLSPLALTPTSTSTPTAAQNSADGQMQVKAIGT